MNWTNWTLIFKDAVPEHAGVMVFDKGISDSLGRYVVSKLMKLANGRTLTKQSYYYQRPAAIRRATAWLHTRAVKAGTTYTPGDGVRTIGYHPLEEAK